MLKEDVDPLFDELFEEAHRADDLDLWHRI